ncbi:MAG: S41 family peptidase [Lentisphaeraceae bacterium]|nr:S41 family peptidase [Lentisphaeraceae bacterium]
MILKSFLLTLCTIFSLHAVEDLPSLYKISAPKEFKSGEKVFSEVMKIVKEGFYDTEGLTDDDLYYAAIKGILRRISPPESPTQGKIWSLADKEKVYGNLQEKKVFSGINSVFDKEEGSLTVKSLIDGSPAIGLLQEKDRIMRIDGKSLKDLSKDELSKLLSGEEGKVVKLKVIRDIEVLDIEITLKEVKIHNCLKAVVEDTGYLRVKSFSSNISGEMKTHLEDFKKQKLKKVIIDLRGNTGGYFTEGVRSAELFLKKGTAIVSVLRSGSKRSDYYSTNLRPYTFDIAVLTNGRTASSSEILAAALRANNKAVLIGVNSYGKAIIEKPFSLSNGYLVKFSVGAMYTYDGQTWHEDGLSPDIKSETKFSKVLSEDPAVKKALNYFKNR